MTPFHWEVEFPEVFLREDARLRRVRRQSPLRRRHSIIDTIGSAYSASGFSDSTRNLMATATLSRISSGGRSACCDHDGAFGLIATNTIAQGDTRSTGLRWICTHGGTIYAARKRYKWPGRAAVVVSVVNVRRGQMAGPFDLDGRQVDVITAFLFHRGGHENPATLTCERSARASQGMQRLWAWASRLTTRTRRGVRIRSR